MPTTITVKDLLATVTIEVDLTEWGKYPDDDGVLAKAQRLLNDVREAARTAPSVLDAQIAALQAKRDGLDSLKPVVTGVDDGGAAQAVTP